MEKPFGLRFTLPQEDPMRADHLLGPNWISERWFETEAQRDAIMRGYQEQFAYYRQGDRPSLVITAIDR